MPHQHARGSILNKTVINASEGQSTDKNKKKSGKKKKKGQTGNSISVEFELPYSREDVFYEVSRTDVPLGVHPKTMRLTVIKNGENPDEPFSAGYTRRLEVSSKLFSGQTVSELVEVVENEKIRWKTVSTVGPFAMVGVKKAPGVVIEFETAPQGCRLELTFEYDYTLLMRPLCCLGMCVPRALQMVAEEYCKKVYLNEMEHRGYQSNAVIASTRIQAACAALLVRKLERTILRREKALGGGGGRKSMAARRSTQGATLKEKLDKQMRDKARAKEDAELAKQKALEAQQRAFNTRASLRRSTMSSKFAGALITTDELVVKRKDVPRRTDIYIRAPVSSTFVK